MASQNSAREGNHFRFKSIFSACLAAWGSRVRGDVWQKIQLGRTMRIDKTGLRRGVLAVAAVLAISLQSWAQPPTRMLLLLQRSQEQEAELRQLMEEQQSKNSSNYHAWLTPDQFGRQFGPADADIQAITDWLTSRGFQISKVSKGRTLVEFSGTAGQVRNAFATEVHKYDVRGEEHLANAQDPQIPSALAP